MDSTEKEKSEEILEQQGIYLNQLQMHQRALGILYDALIWYARPDFYHAVGFAFDSPCGGFDEDFSMDEIVDIHGYLRPMPGKMARVAIDKVANEYGDLIMIAHGIEDGSEEEETLEGAGSEEDGGLAGSSGHDPAGG